MASIVDLCWNNAEDLFHDLDLDTLYLRQIRTLNATRCSAYPYLVLIYTGKITLGIQLGHLDTTEDPLEGLRAEAMYLMDGDHVPSG